jgi:hypothetical protein
LHHANCANPFACSRHVRTRHCPSYSWISPRSSTPNSICLTWSKRRGDRARVPPQFLDAAKRSVRGHSPRGENDNEDGRGQTHARVRRRKTSMLRRGRMMYAASMAGGAVGLGEKEEWGGRAVPRTLAV